MSVLFCNVCPLGAPGHGLGPSRAGGKGGGPGYRAEPDTGAPLLNVAVINLSILVLGKHRLQV